MPLSRAPHALMVLLAVVAALAAGHGARADDDDLLVPLVPPPDAARWRKVPAWEGTFRVTQQKRTKRTKFTSSVDEVTGSVVGTLRFEDEGEHEVRTVGGVEMDRWRGTIKGTVQIDSLSFGWPHIPPSGTVDRSRLDFYNRQSGRGSAECPGVLTLQLATGTYTIDGSRLLIDAPWSKSSNGKTTSGVSRTGVGDYSRGMMQGRLPDTGLVLSGRTRKDFTSGDSGHEQFTYMTSWELHPAGGQVELVVEPQDYDRWLPMANRANYTEPGNEMKITARLQMKDKSPLKAKAKKIVFQLVEVSNEKGVCLNFPPRRLDNPDMPSPLDFDDLRFVQERNEGPWEIRDFGKTAEISGDGLAEATATLSCYDWGAYGVLRVTAVMEAGGEIAGHLVGEAARTEILLPKRQDSSAIADAWKKANKVEGLTDDDDGEELPWGDGNKGDGYSLYEEYRGFMVKGAHVATSPRRKTLFVHSEVPHSKAGTDLFAAATGLEVRVIDADEYLDNAHRWVNFDCGTAHLVNQHGLYLKDGPLDSSTTGLASAIGPPKLVDTIQIHTDYESLFDPRNKPFTIAHELGHGCHVRHHGNGNYDLICVPAAFPGLPATLAGQVLYVAGQRGQNSGVEQCIMRYPSADLYEIKQAGGTTYALYGSPEKRWPLFCNQAGGTGVNAPGHQPTPKCGDAAPGRGLCREQLCVSDLYY